MRLYFVVFSNFISFDPKFYVYNFIYVVLYSLQASLMLQIFSYNIYFFLLLN